MPIALQTALSVVVVEGLSPSPRQDNIIYDIIGNKHDVVDNSASGFGHPKCGFGEDAITLPTTT